LLPRFVGHFRCTVISINSQKRTADVEARLASATEPLITAKNEAEALAAIRQTELTALRADMDKAAVESRKRLEIGLKHQNRAKDLGAAIAEKDRAIAEKEAKIQATEKEIADAKTKITELEMKISEIEKGSAHKDATVSRLTSELATAKKSSGTEQGSEASAEVSCLGFAVYGFGLTAGGTQGREGREGGIASEARSGGEGFGRRKSCSAGAVRLGSDING